MQGQDKGTARAEPASQRTRNDGAAQNANPTGVPWKLSLWQGHPPNSVSHLKPKDFHPVSCLCIWEMNTMPGIFHTQHPHSLSPRFIWPDYLLQDRLHRHPQVRDSEVGSQPLWPPFSVTSSQDTFICFRCRGVREGCNTHTPSTQWVFVLHAVRLAGKERSSWEGQSVTYHTFWEKELVKLCSIAQGYLKINLKSKKSNVPKSSNFYPWLRLPANPHVRFTTSLWFIHT